MPLRNQISSKIILDHGLSVIIERINMDNAVKRDNQYFENLCRTS